MNEIFFQHASNIARQTAGLAAFGSASPDAKTTNQVVFTINGKIDTATAGTIDLTNVSSIDPETGLVVTAPLTLEAGNHCMLSVYLNAAKAFVVEKSAERVAVVDGVLQNLYTTEVARSLNKSNSLVWEIYLLNGTAAQFEGGTTNLDASGMYTIFVDIFSSHGM